MITITRRLYQVGDKLMIAVPTESATKLELFTVTAVEPCVDGYSQKVTLNGLMPITLDVQFQQTVSKPGKWHFAKVVP